MSLNTKQPANYKPTIFRKTLLVVFVPLAIGISGLLLLHQLWLHTERLAAATRQQTEFVRALDLALHGWGDAGTAVMGDLFFNDPASQALFEESVAEMKRRFARLKTLPASLNKQDALAKLESLIDQDILLIKTLPRLGSPDRAEESLKLVKTEQMLAKVVDLRTEIRQILDNEWQTLRKAGWLEDRSTKLMELAVALVAAINVAIGFLLALGASRFFNRRLQSVVENARQLPDATNPERTAEGDDEIAYLDKVINEAHQQLRAARDHRQAIISMVAHDMCSPLAAALIYLKLAEDANVPPAHSDQPTSSENTTRSDNTVLQDTAGSAHSEVSDWGPPPVRQIQRLRTGTALPVRQVQWFHQARRALPAQGALQDLRKDCNLPQTLCLGSSKNCEHSCNAKRMKAKKRQHHLPSSASTQNPPAAPTAVYSEKLCSSL